jgi:hypothetical protein
LVKNQNIGLFPGVSKVEATEATEGMGKENHRDTENTKVHKGNIRRVKN